MNPLSLAILLLFLVSEIECSLAGERWRASHSPFPSSGRENSFFSAATGPVDTFPPPSSFPPVQPGNSPSSFPPVLPGNVSPQPPSPVLPPPNRPGSPQLPSRPETPPFPANQPQGNGPNTNNLPPAPTTPQQLPGTNSSVAVPDEAVDSWRKWRRNETETRQMISQMNTETKTDSLGLALKVIEASVTKASALEVRLDSIPNHA